MEKIISDRRWGYLLLIASLSAICVATIFPFKFVIPEGFSGQFIVNEFNFGSSIKDYWQNILLFVPFGIGLAVIVDRPQQSTLTRLILIISFLASAILSTTIELTQFFLPSRVSNLTDIICNSLGGTLGGIFYGWRSSIVRFIVGILTANPSKLSLKSLFIAIASYCTIVILAIWVLLISVNLSNWDNDFYLAIGNEVTGDRPWNGYIKSLYISDRSLTKSQVAQAFKQPDPFFEQLPTTIASLFTKKRNYRKEDSNYLPDLLWQNTSSSRSERISKGVPKGIHFDISFRKPRLFKAGYCSPQNNLTSRTNSLSSNLEAIQHGDRQFSGILLNSKQWLKSEEPAFDLSQKLKATNEFSLFLTVASKDLNQIGPARILALSDGIYGQNLIIGQEGTSLSFRLRTPITGSNANQPEFIVPNVFNNYGTRQILITFAKRKISFYIDNIDERYSFIFTPYISFHSYFPWDKTNWVINLENINSSEYSLIFYLIVTIPLVILLIITSCFLLLKLVIK